MTIKFTAHLPPGVNTPPPARKYTKRTTPRHPAGSLDELRGRAAAHVARPDAMVIWNGALKVALDRLVNEPELTRERVIELVTSVQADVF